MDRSPSAQSFRAIAASLLCAACTGQVEDPAGAASCSSPAMQTAYNDALASGEVGTTSMHLDQSSPLAASCSLQGLSEGLRRRCHHQHGDDGHKGHHHGHGQGNPGCNHDADQTCKDDGTSAGDTQGQAFCALSISLGGLGVDDKLTPGAANSCSNAYEEACHKAFDQAIANFAQTSGDPNADCAQFTTGDFQEAYEVARFNQCLFSIADPNQPPPGPCDNGQCECHDEANCQLDCPAEGCDVTCKDAKNCSESCGAGCQSNCQDVSTCVIAAEADADLSCKNAGSCALAATSGKVACTHAQSCDVQITDKARVTCEHTGTCTVDAKSADVTCRHAGTCKVQITSGAVRCDHTGSCDVTCGDGSVAPKQCADGRYVCGDTGC